MSSIPTLVSPQPDGPLNQAQPVKAQTSDKEGANDPDIKECLNELVNLNKSLGKMLDNHEGRIAALEALLKEGASVADTKVDQPVQADTPKQDAGQPAQTTVKTNANQDLLKQKRFSCADGPRELWLWKDHKTVLWRGPVESLVTAKNRSAVVAPYYVWIEDGLVARTLTDEEVARYF